jgi:DNA excision repair protein ERCC-4
LEAQRVEARDYVWVTVDDREAKGPVMAALRSRQGVCLQVERLSVGDYRVDDTFIFERKSLLDLVASIKDGRLFAQALRLAESPLRTALILEGTSKDLQDNRMRREAIQGALVTLSLFFGIPLLRAIDPEETASLILFAAKQERAYVSGALQRKGSRPRGKRRVQSYILQGLPRIGPERAKRLLERFGSVEAIMMAPAEALTSVPGIGKTTAEAIRWAVQETAGAYCGAPDTDECLPL